MIDALIVQYLLAQRWALYEPVITQTATVVFRHAAGTKLNPTEIRIAIDRKEPRAWDDDGPSEREQSEDEKRGYTLRGSVAVVPITGVIAKHAPMVGEISKPRGSYVVSLRRALARAAADDQVKSILLMVDSPGGSVAGLGNLADDIRGIRAKGIPVWGYADDMAASAAYWLISQAEKIYGSPNVVAGSIGVYSVLADTSKMYEEAGVKIHLVKAGESKGIGTEGVPITQEQLAVVQADIDAYLKAFKADIRKGRSALTSEELNALADGRVHIGQAAVNAKLIDGIDKAEAVVSRMHRLFGNKPKGGAVVPAAQGGKQGAPAMDDDLNLNDVAGTTKTVTNAGGGAGASLSIEAVKAAAKEAATEAVTAVLEAQKKATDMVAQIEAVCKGWLHVDGVKELQTEALAGRVKVEDLGTKVLGLAEKALKPAGSGNLTVGTTGWERERAGIEAMLLDKAIAGGIERRLRASGEQAEQAAVLANYLGVKPDGFSATLREARANGLPRLRLIDIAERSARANGRLTAGRAVTEEEIIIAAMLPNATLGTSDFSSLMLNVQNKTLLTGFAESPTTYQEWCSIGSSPDFRDSTLITLSDAANLKEIPEGKGKPDESYLNDRNEAIRLKTFARAIVITRQTIMNDDLNALTRIPYLFGLSAARVPEQLAILVLTSNPNMSDGNPVFHAAHNNLGAAAALAMGALQTAINAFMLQRGFGQDKAELDLVPRKLLVPTALQWVAKELYESKTDPTAGAVNVNKPNTTAGMCKPIVSSRLHRNSTTAWYLVGDPNICPTVEVRFLNGRREPIIVQAESGSSLQMKTEIIFDCAAKAAAFENIYKNPGA